MKRERLINLEKRFYESIFHSPCGCWLWIGPNSSANIKKAYPLISVGNSTPEYAHRISYILKYGDIPHKMCVCHRCDTPLCVNPDHLFLGTQYDNMQDKVKKRRTVNSNGESLSPHKLNAPQVFEIRELKHSHTAKELAVIYSVHPASIRSIWRGAAWRALLP